MNRRTKKTTEIDSIERQKVKDIQREKDRERERESGES